MLLVLCHAQAHCDSNKSTDPTLYQSRAGASHLQQGLPMPLSARQQTLTRSLCLVLIDQSGVLGFDLDRLSSDSMDLTNVQPTTPIGGYAAGGVPGEPQELGQRESARAVLSTMLETPADPGGASAEGGGINLQSVMGQLLGTGLRESVTAKASELPVFANLQDANGAALSPEMKEQIATELTAMVMKTFATTASPVASPTKRQNTVQSPIRVLETAIATSLS